MILNKLSNVGGLMSYIPELLDINVISAQNKFWKYPMQDLRIYF